jgi:elongation factor P
MIAKDIKPGAVMNYNGSPILMESVSVQSPSARGAATLYKFRARNLVTKQKLDLTLKGTDALDEADFQKRVVQFMFSDATHSHFLDQTDYNQYAIENSLIENERNFITESMESLYALIYNDECVGLQVPATVVLSVVECDPVCRGNSATGRTKAAKTQTGFVVQVPEYLAQGETIKVDSRTGEFLSRA